MEIPSNLLTEIILYCKANSITDVDAFVLKLIKAGFTSEKYGSVPNITREVKEAVMPPKQEEKVIEIVKEEIKEEPKQKKSDLYGEN